MFCSNNLDELIKSKYDDFYTFFPQKKTLCTFCTKLFFMLLCYWSLAKKKKKKKNLWLITIKIGFREQNSHFIYLSFYVHFVVTIAKLNITCNNKWLICMIQSNNKLFCQSNSHHQIGSFQIHKHLIAGLNIVLIRS